MYSFKGHGGLSQQVPSQQVAGRRDIIIEDISVGQSHNQESHKKDDPPSVVASGTFESFGSAGFPTIAVAVVPSSEFPDKEFGHAVPFGAYGTLNKPAVNRFPVHDETGHTFTNMAAMMLLQKKQEAANLAAETAGSYGPGVASDNAIQGIVTHCFSTMIDILNPSCCC